MPYADSTLVSEKLPGMVTMIVGRSIWVVAKPVIHVHSLGFLGRMQNQNAHSAEVSINAVAFQSCGRESKVDRELRHNMITAWRCLLHGSHRKRGVLIQLNTPTSRSQEELAFNLIPDQLGALVQ